MQTLFQDFRHGVRLLVRAPGFSATAIAALAIGIGANAAIFSVVNTVLLRQLPYADPDRLAVIWEHNIPRDRKNNVVSPGNFLHWREMNSSFTDLAAVSLTVNVTVTGDGDPEEVPVQLVSSQFFRLLGVAPAIGRPFTAEEDRPDSRVAVISDRLWKRRFGGSASILTRPVSFGGVPSSVVGVMPPGFSFLDKTVDVWMPIGFSAEARTPRGRWLSVLGRLMPGVTMARAQEDMARVHAELTRLYPEFNTGWTARVVPLKEELTGEVRPALLVLLAAVALVLLIACANVANLLLARASARQRELAVRAALGAGRLRLIRQLFAESLVLAGAGGAAGLLLAYWMLQLLRGAVAQNLPVQRLELVAIDGRVLTFTVAVSLASGVIFGAIPALTGSTRFGDALKDGGRGGSGSRGNRTRGTLVTAEVALALVLLVGAGLLLRSFLRLLDVNPGFDRTHTITMRVSLPQARYGTDTSRMQFFDRTFAKIDALPGVNRAGAVSFLPLTGPGAATRVEIMGKPAPPLGQEPVTDVRVVRHQYFEAMGIPLLKGRLFDAREATDPARRVVVINETMANRYWPGEDPLGKRVRVSWNQQVEDEVIGVVGDVRHATLDTAARPTTYWPYPRTAYPTMTLVVRSAGDPSSLVNSVIAIVAEQDPQLAVANIQTLEEVIATSVAERRLLMLLLAVFAGAALLLAAVGIYGVIACSVTERTQEIGIRMALGARQGQILRMVVGQALVLGLAGIGAGGAGALLLTRLLTGFLFEVRPADPATFGSVAALLACIAVLASYFPGRRASRVDPVIALRAN